MDAANRGTARVTLRNAFAGLEAGVLGALLMISWLMLGSAWSQRSVWIVPNLFATTFYGPDVYANLLTRASWSGVALLLAIYGFGGVVWGVIWGAVYGDSRRPFLVVFGAIAGLAVYFLFFNLIWKYVNPLIPLYAPLTRMRVAHILWGGALSRFPGFSRRIAEVFSDSYPSGQEAAEIRSGEVIL